MAGTVALTFDCHESAYTNGSQPLYDRNIKATFFSQPDRIGNGTELTQYSLTVLKMLGHEVGLYLDGINQTSGALMNIPAYMAAYGAAATNARILEQHNQLAALGFKPRTAAAAGRLWNINCGNLARDFLSGVRVGTGFGWPTYPLSDPMNILNGGYESLNSSTNVEGVLAAVDDCSEVNGLFTIVVHGIAAAGQPGDGMHVPLSKFEAILDGLVTRRSAGLRVCTFEEALSPATT